MSDLQLPILEEGASQRDAMRHIAEAGAAAVRDGADVRLVTARIVLDAPADLNASDIAGAHGIVAAQLGEILRDDGVHVTFRPERPELPQFEVPAGYLQCRDDGNHTYDIQSGLTQCPVDKAPLSVVYLDS
jgi:hypothetical protein